MCIRTRRDCGGALDHVFVYAEAMVLSFTNQCCIRRNMHLVHVTSLGFTYLLRVINGGDPARCPEKEHFLTLIGWTAAGVAQRDAW